MMTLLHGTLQVTIFEADSLSNPRAIAAEAGEQKCIPKEVSTQWKRRFAKRMSWIKRVPFCCPKITEGIEGTVLGGGDAIKLYATVDLQKARVGRTRTIANDPVAPRWYESFRIYCAHSVADVVFTVKSANPVGASVIGRAYLPVEQVIYGGVIDRWLEIQDGNRNPVGGARIHVRLRYVDVRRDPTAHWGRGVLGVNYTGVPATYFQQQRGCRVTLYQDSHVLDSFTPLIQLSGGRLYEPHRCWKDIFAAISDARRFVYITGWSVNTEITLVRDPGSPSTTLGELLKRKASEGVRVLMLVWDDRTSVEYIKKDGLMATHDQETGNYFRGTDVRCVLCPRNPDAAASRVQDLEIATLFTHHQKSVVLDVETGRRGLRRRVVSFIGGIDLCDGRYDTQRHSLFRTLGGVHHNDFHQPNFPGATVRKGGPREPWHDIHCRLEGPAAWDVLTNFEQRWAKQGAGTDLLLPVADLADVEPKTAAVSDDREAWSVQVFRSIDGGAAAGFPDTPEAAAATGLVSGKDHVIDRSIQDAYINAIRRAKDFIYIENQYFLGSSYDWRADGIRPEDINAIHLIPKELALKVVSKIEAGERFTVYVVLPMWPEGEPESASVQAILDWQRRTMEMMYADIVQALRAKGMVGVDPREYLEFFCLGNRESREGGEYVPEESPEPGTDYSRAQQARRFMIYVHAKMMIVDDEYIIIGSANINQRSMEGSRDTEIAMGAYQPYHLASVEQPVRGEIHGFRMSLWYEHLGVLDQAFLQPGSPQCVQTVSRMAQQNWEIYASDGAPYRDLPGHLLRYPIQVDGGGRVRELPGMKYFPDTHAPVLGAKSEFLPPILTT